MSATITGTEAKPTTEPEYVYFHYDGKYGHRREVLKGDKAKSTFSEIPLIDVADIFSDRLEDRKRVASEVANACENVGFLYIKNHGVDQRVIDETFETSKAYFTQPLEKKMEQWIYKGKNLRGYEPVHGARVDETTKLGDRKESFLFNYDADEDPVPPQLTPEQRALILESQWPIDQPEFKKKLFAYHSELITLARHLTRTFALGLDLEDTHFDTLVTAPNTSTKLLHYPPQEPDSTDETGIGAHTDFVCFTILNQDAVPGLEVLNANSHWVPATPIPGTFVVNVGDFLMRLSNNRFVSTVHRVKNITGKARYSIPFFFSFNMDALIEVLPSCQSENNPPKYPPITVGEYYSRRHEMQRQKYALRKQGQ